VGDLRPVLKGGRPWSGPFFTMNPIRITIDASHTAGSGKNTGIERVVRNLCHHLPQAATARGMNETQVAIHIHRHFFAVDQLQRRGLDRMSRWEANVQAFLPQWFQAIPSFFLDRWPNPTLTKWFRPSSSHLGGYKIPHQFYAQGVKWGRYARGGAIDPSSRELLILPDAYWTEPGIWDTVARYREAGTFVVTVVYDLIPLTHPQFVGERRQKKFRLYLEDLVRNSDLIVAISKTVRDDVLRFIEDEMALCSMPLCRDVRFFKLGAEIHYTEGSVRPEIAGLFSASRRNSPYLMVGSFDPRKNHHQAIDAFEQLWGEDPNLKLCMFGRKGSMCEDVIERIRNHPMLDRGLYVFHDANDAELLHAYQHASGVLLPSIVEGFGLPIVESLWHGKKTFVSDTPIHREVGGDQCEFFELGSPSALANAILAWESQREGAGARNTNPSRSLPTTWEGSAEQLLDQCLDAYASRAGISRSRAA
jgi:glycosyltransferase involved in cell wall biosynthesis